MYYVELPENNCSKKYTCETGRQLAERVIDHNGRDTKSNIFQHAIEKEHRPPTID